MIGDGTVLEVASVDSSVFPSSSRPISDLSNKVRLTIKQWGSDLRCVATSSGWDHVLRGTRSNAATIQTCKLRQLPSTQKYVCHISSQTLISEDGHVRTERRTETAVPNSNESARMQLVATSHVRRRYLLPCTQRVHNTWQTCDDHRNLCSLLQDQDDASDNHCNHESDAYSNRFGRSQGIHSFSPLLPF